MKQLHLTHRSPDGPGIGTPGAKTDLNAGNTVLVALGSGIVRFVTLAARTQHLPPPVAT